MPHRTDSGHQLAMALRAAYWTMHRAADAELGPHGVTADQFVLLSLLADSDALTQQEVGRKANSDPNTVRAMLLLLEKRGFVARKRHPTDGRALLVSLTAKGRRAYEQLWRESENFRTALAGLLEPGDVKSLIDQLRRIAAMRKESSAGAAPRTLAARRPARSR